jgi:tRNA-dihydrouridine synthase C
MLWVEHGKPALAVAPMEGVTDAPMRAFLSERGGFTFCVSEFLRISQNIPPIRVYREHLPEMEAGCLTPSRVPVQLQLLGGDPQLLADAAVQGIEAGAKAIDLNFGCPAPTVNRHDGGATLLKYPERIRNIVRAVRDVVPSQFPVSAKLRLGWDTREPILTNALMAAEGGASWITIHARTRAQGYAPPVDWASIGEARKRVGIPVVANGDIWSLELFRQCREMTGSEHFMLGRSALANPYLALLIAEELGVPGAAEKSQEFGARDFDPRVMTHWYPLVSRFAQIAHRPSDRTDYLARRTKQWMKMASIGHRFDWFDVLKRLATFEEILELLSRRASESAASIRCAGVSEARQSERQIK